MADVVLEVNKAEAEVIAEALGTQAEGLLDLARDLRSHGEPEKALELRDAYVRTHEIRDKVREQIPD